jgi:hypothetical protein
MLRELAKDLWVREQPLKLLGMEMGTRMTVVRLADGSLWLHSPVKLEDSLKRALDSAGRVAFLVAPNRLHHLFIGDYLSAYPDAQACATPGLETKRRDLRFSTVLSDQPPPGWAGQIDQFIFPALGFLNEVAFFHRASRTLVLTDLAFNFVNTASAYTRLALWLDGALGGLAVPRTARLAFAFNRAACRKGTDRILEWDFDRVIVAHGEVVDHGRQSEALCSIYVRLKRAGQH